MARKMNKEKGKKLLTNYVEYINILQSPAHNYNYGSDLGKIFRTFLWDCKTMIHRNVVLTVFYTPRDMRYEMRGEGKIGWTQDLRVQSVGKETRCIRSKQGGNSTDTFSARVQGINTVSLNQQDIQVLMFTLFHSFRPTQR